ncbi:MAG: hypothetical protein AMJ78_01020 [Omnitrophica WOR_2 bacterium SM23_29]|nr:MAG: hypothetical protein AMJ78_01020 [Omnitrophica WOR_2 bacterium SM23_29]
MREKILYIVHCVDAEGPHYESLEATFERLYDIYGISLAPSGENLRKIQNREIDFGRVTELIARTFSPHMLSYNDSWNKIDFMLKKILSPEFRNRVLDSFGNGWIYNWFCVDHVGYDYNPRKKDIGYHKIYDFYKQILQKYNSFQDGIHWHFHPMSVYKEAHRCATSYVNSPHLYEILCRRIIERNYFPTAVRAGFQTERPDSHLFFEQWMPFDFSNWSCKSNSAKESERDLRRGRSGDWRLAPDDWSVYQPSFDSWQIPGTCRRWIARCIDMLIRGRELPQEEVDKAFARADSGKPTLMAFNNHDFRDMAYEIDCIREKIIKAAKKFPSVKFKFCEAVKAFRSVIYGTNHNYEPVELSLSLRRNDKELFLEIETTKGKVFGPQPFLAVKTRSKRFIHDNLDFDTSLLKWSYTFDYDSIHSDDVETIGVATCDKYGNTFVKVIKF